MTSEKELYRNPRTGELSETHPKGKPLTPGGAEILDPTPMAPPVGWFKQPSMFDHIRAMIRQAQLDQEVESFEDADDFDVGDDYDPTSPWEQEHDGLSVRELRERRLADEEAQKASGSGAAPHDSKAAAGGPPPSPTPASASDPDYQAWLAAKAKA